MHFCGAWSISELKPEKQHNPLMRAGVGPRCQNPEFGLPGNVLFPERHSCAQFYPMEGRRENNTSNTGISARLITTASEQCRLK